MRIIQQGKPFGHRVECECGTIYEAEEADLKVGYFGPNWGGESPERKAYCDCPTCHKQHRIDWYALPQKVQEGLNQRFPQR